jgi:hypothetical protein
MGKGPCNPLVPCICASCLAQALTNHLSASGSCVPRQRAAVRPRTTLDRDATGCEIGGAPRCAWPMGTIDTIRSACRAAAALVAGVRVARAYVARGRQLRRGRLRNYGGASIVTISLPCIVSQARAPKAQPKHARGIAPHAGAPRPPARRQRARDHGRAAWRHNRPSAQLPPRAVEIVLRPGRVLRRLRPTPAPAFWLAVGRDAGKHAVP